MILAGVGLEKSLKNATEDKFRLMNKSKSIVLVPHRTMFNFINQYQKFR